MKKLLILTAVAILAAASVGCQCDWFRRGGLFGGAETEMPVYDACPPCDPCGTTCDPCAGGTMGTIGGGGSMMLPGPVTTTPSQ